MDCTLTIPGHVRESVNQWIYHYDALVSRSVPTDPEGHEQSLMESSRLLGAAGAMLRLIESLALDVELAPAPDAIAGGYPGRHLSGPGYVPPGDPYPSHQAAVDALATVPPLGPLSLGPGAQGGRPAPRASCGHIANSDGECGCSWWPERAPGSEDPETFDAFAWQGPRP